MNTTTANPLALPPGIPAAARTVLRLLARLQHGSLTLQLPDGALRHFGPGGAPHGAIVLHNWKVCGAALRSGDIGFAESYIAGNWSTPHLTDLLKLLIANRHAVESVVYGSWAGRLASRLRHLLRRNTRAGSKKNIHAHYDLGNRALLETRVQPGERVLEIGCGWGALAEMAATEFGASITGVTLSTEQLAFANARLERLGVPAAQRDLRLQDYRDIADAPFDAICSIEMVEAVGREYWPTYFQAVARLLKPGGRACIQSIVIDDRLFERYIGSTDFIQQYIFPGGCLPCQREFRREAEAAGLTVTEELAFGFDYAETLKRWRERFIAERAQILAQGFDQRFLHIWEFYLAYCEAAFAMGDIDVVQYTLHKRKL